MTCGVFQHRMVIHYCNRRIRYPVRYDCFLKQRPPGSPTLYRFLYSSNSNTSTTTTSDSNSTEGGEESDEDDDTVYKIGRRRRHERTDSVNETILEERKKHLASLQAYPVDEDLVKRIKKMGLGRKKIPKDSSKFRRGVKDEASLLGAGGFATYLASAKKNWPVFKHMLPEIALAGHSNSGKSSLVNSLAGLAARRGVAKVSDRAGWTDALYFYSMGKKPPVMILVDFPGYGFAVAHASQKRQWKEMTHDFLAHRQTLCRCCILIDCTRGVCEEDHALMRTLAKFGREFMIILTKGDLLPPEGLAKCVAKINDTLSSYPNKVPEVVITSASTGGGVQELWESLKRCVYQNADTTTSVPIHKAFAKGLGGRGGIL